MIGRAAQRGYVLLPAFFGSSPPPVYATWNPADKGSGCVLSGGNLTATANCRDSVRSTVGVSSGKHYWEYTSSSPFLLTGIGSAAAITHSAAGNAYPGIDAFGWSMFWQTGEKANNAVFVAYNGSGIFTGLPVTVGVKLDMDAGALSFVIGGVDKGVAYSGLVGPIFAMFGGGSTGAADAVTANFGASAFAFSVPSGYRPGLYT